MSSLISSIRSYYSTNVVGRVLAAHASGTTEGTVVSHNYASIPGAIPLPATLSLELGDVIKEQQANITYRFVSDLPFKSRASHELDDFEKNALAALRANPQQTLNDLTRVGLTDTLRFITPVVMGQACVACHNTHPESPKTDWKVGDVRGIQEVIIRQPYASNVFAFKYLLCYFLFVAFIGISFIVLQRQQTRTIHSANQDLEAANEFLASVSLKISRYLSPQIYKSIFSGQKDVVVHTERKRLTIFFSDIKDFTRNAEHMQPEDLTYFLNNYFSEMSKIALEYGATIDKFIGDAIVIFFGDPETRGVEEDARQCVRMAVAMQRRMRELQAVWRDKGYRQPFQVRIGINTGFCHVGNFGSDQRMDYTIIGSEVNIAARLEQNGSPDGVVMSYETYALVKGEFEADEREPLAAKGVSRDVRCFLLRGIHPDEADERTGIHQNYAGLQLSLEPGRLTEATRDQARRDLQAALAVLDASPRPVPPASQT
jgi:adenylate cyclase